MHQLFIMCFSSSLICLLVVTCHGSVVNKYRSETGYPDNEGEHSLHDDPYLPHSVIITHHRHNSSDAKNVPNDLHQNISTVDLISLEKDSTMHQIKNVTKRSRSSTGSEFAYPFLKQNSYSDQTHSQLSSLKKKRSKTYFHGDNHDHHSHHNDSDHDPLLEENSHHDSDSHEHHEEDEEDYDFSGQIDEALPSTNDMHEKSIQQKVINPCVNKEFGHEHHKHHKDEPIEGAADNFHQHPPSSSRDISGRVWLYASLAVVIISLCGLFSVAVIPIMQKWFYHTLLQFLVGLAVGSLSGDGLLHLMPHAILDGELSHDHANGESHDHDVRVSLKAMEVKAVWRGLAALSGIFLFFIAERLLGAITTYRRQQKESKLSRHPKSMIPVSREDGANNGSVGEKLAQPKKNSYDHIREKDEKETIQMLPTEASPSKKGSNQSIHEIGFHGRSSFSLEPEATVAYRPDSESSVIVSEHHGHSHAHSHEIPQSVTAVAWMVILGDGLHNFCDGLAIGAAFASGDADGISTTVAVFCHELPHELGDFAMLLKTGMKVKQALFYNLLSSVLCFVGMVIGVALGNVHSATNWVFAGTAGMFLYIALVDMLPELTLPTNTSSSGAVTTLFVQVLGIVIGVSVMLLIALYEHELHSIVS